MPTVPTYDNRTVRSAPAPDQYLRTNPTPDAFGAMEGRALQGAAADLARAGAALSETAHRQQAQDDAAALLQAQTAYGQRLNVRLYQDETDATGQVHKGLFTTQGSEAMGVAGKFATLEGDIYKEVAATLKTPEQRLAFDKVRQRQMASYSTAAMKHEADNRLKFQAETTDAAVKTSTLNAVNAFDKPEIVAGEIDNIKRAVAATNVGSPPEVVGYKTRVAVSAVHKSIVGRMLTDDPKGAKAYYDGHKDAIEGGDHLDIQRALEVPMRRVRLDETFNGIVAGSGTPGSRLVRAVVGQESSGNRNAESPKGASGLMQVMPDTGRYISRAIGDGTNIDSMSDAEIKAFYKANPAINLTHGAFYLQEQLNRYGGDVEVALIAYNAGPKNADKFVNARAAGNPDPYSVLPVRSETEPYVRKIMGNLGKALGNAGGDPSLPVPTRGQAVIPVEFGALPIPASMAARASGAQSPYAAPVSEATMAAAGLGSAAAALTPFVPDADPAAAAAVAPVPDQVAAGKPLRVRADDFDPEEIRAQAQAAAEADPEIGQALLRKAEAYIAKREREKKSALKEVANAGWAHVMQGGDTTDLPAGIYAALIEQNPTAIKSMEEFVDRRERRRDKTDEATYYQLSQMTPQQIAADDFDLMAYAPKLSAEHLRHFAQVQADARKGIRDLTQGAGIVSAQEIGNMALGKMGIETTGKKATPASEARAGLFFMRFNQEVSALQAREKRKATNEEIQKIADALTAPVVQGGVFASPKYRFEMGTAPENESRQANALPPLGETTGVFEAAKELKDVPDAARTTIIEKHIRLNGAAPTPKITTDIYNQALTASTGRPVPVPSEKISAFKSAMSKALGRVPDDKELPMLYSRWLRREYPLRIGE